MKRTFEEYWIEQESRHACLPLMVDNDTYRQLCELFELTPDQEESLGYDPKQDTQCFWVYYGLVLDCGEGVLSTDRSFRTNRIYVRSDIEIDKNNKGELKWYACGIFYNDTHKYDEPRYEFQTGLRGRKKHIYPKMATRAILKSYLNKKQ